MVRPGSVGLSVLRAACCAAAIGLTMPVVAAFRIALATGPVFVLAVSAFGWFSPEFRGWNPPSHELSRPPRTLLREQAERSGQAGARGGRGDIGELGSPQSMQGGRERKLSYRLGDYILG